MPVGDSGRIVVEMDPEEKRVLHQLLKADGTSLKEWFLGRVDEYLQSKAQQGVLFDRSGNPTRRVG